MVTMADGSTVVLGTGLNFMQKELRRIQNQLAVYERGVQLESELAGMETRRDTLLASMTADCEREAQRLTTLQAECASVEEHLFSRKEWAAAESTRLEASIAAKQAAETALIGRIADLTTQFNELKARFA